MLKCMSSVEFCHVVGVMSRSANEIWTLKHNSTQAVKTGLLVKQESLGKLNISGNCPVTGSESLETVGSLVFVF